MTSGETHHENRGRQEDVTGGSDRSFGLVFAVVFLLLGLVSAYSAWKGENVLTLLPDWLVLGLFWWAMGLSFLFGLLALIAPGVLNPLNHLWTLFGALLHAIMSPVILAVLFYLVFMPIGLALRLVGKELLSAPDKSAASYWIQREPPGPDPSTMPQQF